jgi:hypothetical protein
MQCKVSRRTMAKLKRAAKQRGTTVRKLVTLAIRDTAKRDYWQALLPRRLSR